MGKEHKKHKKEKREKKEKKEKKHKSREKHREEGGKDRVRAALAAIDIPVLTADDYFARMNEFRVWLRRRKQAFEDLTTEETHSQFAKFVERWNARELDPDFYVGLAEDDVEAAKRTKHKWGFLGKLSGADRDKLEAVHDSVAAITNKGGSVASASAAAAAVTTVGPGLATAAAARAVAASITGASREQPSQVSSRQDRGDDRHSRKRERRDREADLEELVPKETGRGAMIEKRKQLTERVHGAARDREANMDGLELPDSVLMGGGGSSELEQLKRARARRDVRREQEAAERRRAAVEREQDKMQAFVAQMGLQPGQKITIPPRPPQ